MAIGDDNQLETQTAGTADWDAGLSANFTILERGQHVTVQAGMDINTGWVCWVDSGAWAHHYDTNSVDIRPHGIAYVGANSGDDVQLLVRGTVRSLDITSTVVPGIDAYVDVDSPGLVVNSYSGSWPAIGWGIGAGQLYFDPHSSRPMQRMTSVTTISVVESLHLFEADIGGYGWVRETEMFSDSGDLIRLWFYSDSLRTAPNLLYQVLSGGVSTIGSFYDRAGWPFENSDAGISGLIFGVAEVHSLGNSLPTDLGITLVAERRN